MTSTKIFFELFSRCGSWRPMREERMPSMIRETPVVIELDARTCHFDV